MYISEYIFYFVHKEEDFPSILPHHFPEALCECQFEWIWPTISYIIPKLF